MHIDRTCDRFGEERFRQSCLRVHRTIDTHLGSAPGWAPISDSGSRTGAGQPIDHYLKEAVGVRPLGDPGKSLRRHHPGPLLDVFALRHQFLDKVAVPRDLITDDEAGHRRARERLCGECNEDWKHGVPRFCQALPSLLGGDQRQLEALDEPNPPSPPYAYA